LKKRFIDYGLVLAGVLLTGIGLFWVKTIADPQGIMRTLPYVCIGVGSGAFGSGMGNVISRRILKNSPDLQKQQEINKNDERNVAIANRAKAKAYDIMVFVFGALMLSYALMAADVAEVLLLVFAYLFVIGSGLYYRCKYDREM
jgi:hypothetical protein